MQECAGVCRCMQECADAHRNMHMHMGKCGQHGRVQKSAEPCATVQPSDNSMEAHLSKAQTPQRPQGNTPSSRGQMELMCRQVDLLWLKAMTTEQVAKRNLWIAL